MNKGDIKTWSKNTAILAAIFGFLQVYPSIVKVIKTGNVSSYSRTAQIMGLISAAFWFINAYLSGDVTSMIALSIGIGFSSYILYLMYETQDKKDKQAKKN